MSPVITTIIKQRLRVTDYLLCMSTIWPQQIFYLWLFPDLMYYLSNISETNSDYEEDKSTTKEEQPKVENPGLKLTQIHWDLLTQTTTTSFCSTFADLSFSPKCYQKPTSQLRKVKRTNNWLKNKNSWCQLESACL